MLIRNIPVGIIKKNGKDPNKLTVMYKYEQSVTGYACTSFPKDAFTAANKEGMYNLEVPDDKKHCISFKNNTGAWRNKWVDSHQFTATFNQSRQRNQQSGAAHDERPLPDIDIAEENIMHTDIMF